jgi:hypothetical protein
MYNQISDTIFMVKPIAFHKNEQTAVNNYFQHNLPGTSRKEAQEKALVEFDLFVSKLRSKDIEVIVFEDTEKADTPDSIFPNNWVTFHDDGTIVLYPMFAPNRRKERRQDIIDYLKKQYFIREVFSLTSWEEKSLFLEGTGSLILDRPHKLAYAAVSERTSAEVLHEFGKLTGYTIIAFQANQTVEDERKPIYHTNVMMSIGEKFAVVCLESIDDIVEREKVNQHLIDSGKEIVEISESQVVNFAGNILQAKSKYGKPYIVMSTSAFEAFTEEQKSILKRHGDILHSPIPTIELLGGGSVRCMIAEVFLPKPTLLSQMES